MNTENIEKWLEDNNLSNNALKIGETHRVELYLSDVLLKFYEEQVKNNDLLHSVIDCTNLEPDFIKALNELVDTQRKPTKKRF